MNERIAEWLGVPAEIECDRVTAECDEIEHGAYCLDCHYAEFIYPDYCGDDCAALEGLMILVKKGYKISIKLEGASDNGLRVILSIDPPNVDSYHGVLGISEGDNPIAEAFADAVTEEVYASNVLGGPTKLWRITPALDQEPFLGGSPDLTYPTEEEGMSDE